MLSAYGAYELDPAMLLQYPAMWDLSAAAVVAFHDALEVAGGLQTEGYPGPDSAREYIDAVTTLRTNWAKADRYARSTGTSTLPDADAQSCDRALKLLRHAEGTEGPERAAYLQRVNALAPLAAAFKAETGVELVLVEKGFGQIRDDFKVAGPAGQGPDILIGAHDWLGELAASGLLAEVNLGDKAADFEPVAVDAFKYGGKLYGMPYAVAPEAQKRVPLVAWTGPLGKRTGIDAGCLRGTLDAPLTHDHLYHTVLALMDVRSPTYRPGLDAFAPCRGSPA